MIAILITGTIISLLILIGVPALIILAWLRLRKISFFDHQNDPLFWNMAPKTMARTAEHFAKMRLMEVKEQREHNMVVIGDQQIEINQLKIKILEKEAGVNQPEWAVSHYDDQPSPPPSSSPPTSPGPGSR